MSQSNIDHARIVRIEERVADLEKMSDVNTNLLIRIDERTTAMQRDLTIEGLEKKFVTITRFKPWEWVGYTIGGALLLGIAGSILRLVLREGL